MFIKLNGKWEASRIARIIKEYAKVDASIAKWCDDCSNRIESQAEAERNYYRGKSRRDTPSTVRTGGACGEN